MLSLEMDEGGIVKKIPRRGERLGFERAGNRIALLMNKGLEHRSTEPPLRNTVSAVRGFGGVGKTGMDITACA